MLIFLILFLTYLHLFFTSCFPFINSYLPSFRHSFLQLFILFFNNSFVRSLFYRYCYFSLHSFVYLFIFFLIHTTPSHTQILFFFLSCNYLLFLLIPSFTPFYLVFFFPVMHLLLYLPIISLLPFSLTFVQFFQSFPLSSKTLFTLAFIFLIPLFILRFCFVFLVLFYFITIFTHLLISTHLFLLLQHPSFFSLDYSFFCIRPFAHSQPFILVLFLSSFLPSFIIFSFTSSPNQSRFHTHSPSPPPTIHAIAYITRLLCSHFCASFCSGDEWPCK